MNFQFAQKLSELFHPLVEISIYNHQKLAPRVVYNRFSNEETSIGEIKKEEIFTQTLKNGRQLKCMVFELKQSSEWMLIRFDTSFFHLLKDQLSLILPTEKKESISPLSNGKEQIQAFIENYLLRNNLPRMGIGRTQKRSLILALYQNDLFQFKDASKVIAEALRSSRATIYNYLDWAKKVRQVKVQQVDAFTDEPCKGNPAGVVLDASSLDEKDMKKIAREMNFPETAFVLPSEKGDFSLRYFTRSGHEVSFCGHSTVSTLFMIAKEGLFNQSPLKEQAFLVETKSGLISMETKQDKKGETIAVYQSPQIDLIESDIDLEKIAKLLGLEQKEIDVTKKALFERTNQDLFISVQSLDSLKKISPNYPALTKLLKEKNIVALSLVTHETFNKKNHAHARVFCPAVGVLEDFFTGSMQGGLAAFLHQNKMIPKDKTTLFIEQGHFLERPGVVKVKFTENKGDYQAKIFAQAVHFFSTEMNLI